MKEPIEWIDEVGQTVATEMFSLRNPPGVAVETLVKRIQDDARGVDLNGSDGMVQGEIEDTPCRLKPCPFCGGRADLRRTPQGGAFVDCGTCQASSKLVYGDKTDPRQIVIEAWNERKGEL